MPALINNAPTISRPVWGGGLEIPAPTINYEVNSLPHSLSTEAIGSMLNVDCLDCLCSL